MPRWFLVPMLATIIAPISAAPARAQCVECTSAQLCDDPTYRDWAICITFASQGARWCNHMGAPGSDCEPFPDEEQALSPSGTVAMFPFDPSACKRADETAEPSEATQDMTDGGLSYWSSALRWSLVFAIRGTLGGRMALRG